ncbi:hypothetical protein LMG28614_00994 [Paraburkholderia ultramafica]|uniref:Uncharacterized protein n=1 Tax=Paraburkholderia ultramafica TaxID=1544867 RepID=A0A6S7AXA9_9BURK|nr:hypothetical protein LMG28614_00994 [Paraburkholderia ultramafica]
MMDDRNTLFSQKTFADAIELICVEFATADRGFTAEGGFADHRTQGAGRTGVRDRGALRSRPRRLDKLGSLATSGNPRQRMQPRP